MILYDSVWFSMTLHYSACIILSVRLNYDYVCMSIWILMLLICPYYDSVCLSEP